MRIAFSVDAADLGGAGVLGHLRLPDRAGNFAVSWHDGVDYAGFAGIKDMQPLGDDIAVLCEGMTGARHLGRLVGGRTIENCVFFRRLNRPLCLLAHDGMLLIGHVGGVSSFDPRLPNRVPVPVRELPNGRVVSMAAFDGRVIASVQVERELTKLIDVETGETYWSDGRDRQISKLVVWQGRLAASDAHNAELVVIDGTRADIHPLRYGYLRGLCALEDGSLLITRNVWRKYYRRFGDRFRGRRLLPAWWNAASYLQQRAAELVVVDPSGQVRSEIPFAHLAWEISAALARPGEETGLPDQAAQVRAIYQRAMVERNAADLRDRLNTAEESSPPEA